MSGLGGGCGGGIGGSYQPGVYVPLKALFLVSLARIKKRIYYCFYLHIGEFNRLGKNVKKVLFKQNKSCAIFFT